MIYSQKAYGTLRSTSPGPPEPLPCRPPVWYWFVKLLAVVLVLGLFYVLYETLIFIVLLHGWPNANAPPSPDLRNENFAVGFDLGAGYGTTAISFRNGTILNVARIDGDNAYREVMARLSLESSAHPTPPYYDWGAQHHDLPRQILRKVRQRLGLPASHDVRALISVLSPLKASAERMLGNGSKVRYALVTVPDLPALYNEDLLDACKHLEMQPLQPYLFRSGDTQQWPVTELNTAYAGMGLGLCENWMNRTYEEPCKGHIPRDLDVNVLNVALTSQALMVHVLPQLTAEYFIYAVGTNDFTMGLDRRTDYEDIRGYWGRVRSIIRETLSEFWRGSHIDIVVLHGDHAVNEEFQQIVKDEVRKAQVIGRPTPQYYITDPVFAGARGAAELGKRCILRGYDCFPDLRPRGPGW